MTKKQIECFAVVIYVMFCLSFLLSAYAAIIAHAALSGRCP
jgi:hypothetical protein